MATIAEAAAAGPSLAVSLPESNNKYTQEQISSPKPLLPALETLPGAHGIATLGSASRFLLSL